MKIGFCLRVDSAVDTFKTASVKTMKWEKLATKNESLQQLIAKTYVDSSNKAELIKDGSFNAKEYAASTPRILWFLKEPYCDGDSPTGGGWEITKDADSDKIAKWRTFQPICSINHGIWRGIHDWEQMPKVNDSAKIRLGLKKIAFINVSKLPGLKTSAWRKIAKAYAQYRAVLHKQIEIYEPNIIFGCDPHINLLIRDMGFNSKQWLWFDPAQIRPSAAVIKVSERLRIIWVDHPSARGQRRRYVNDAICAAVSPMETTMPTGPSMLQGW